MMGYKCILRITAKSGKFSRVLQHDCDMIQIHVKTLGLGLITVLFTRLSEDISSTIQYYAHLRTNIHVGLEAQSLERRDWPLVVFVRIWGWFLSCRYMHTDC